MLTFILSQTTPVSERNNQLQVTVKGDLTMNTTEYELTYRDNLQEAVVKYVVLTLLGLIITCINGTLVVIFFQNSIFHRDPRYILYIHLVINDTLVIFVSVITYLMSYLVPLINVSFCCLVLIIGSTVDKNTPMNLAVMAIERYIAICRPLHHAQICTVRRTYIVICLIWGLGFLPELADIFIIIATRPLSIFNSLIFCFTLSFYAQKYHKEKLTFVQALYMSAVWLALLYTYIRVVLTARKASADRSAQKAQNTIILHAAQLLLCMLSYLLPLLSALIVPYFPAHRTKIMFVLFLMSQIMPRLLSCLIYGLRDPKFVKYLRIYFPCRHFTIKPELA